MSETKICNICNLEKEISCFNKSSKSKDGHQVRCKTCVSEYNKLRYLNNPNIVKERAKNWKENNLERRKEIANNHANKKYRENIAVSRAKNRKQKKKELENKTDEEKKLFYKKNNDNRRKRCENNPLDKLKHAIRSTISNSISKRGYKKKSKSFQILGCSYEEFKNYIESRFESWMTWTNYALYNGELNHGWDIDHITPLSSGKSEEEVLRLNHYTNLQPLCSYINRVIKRG